VTGPFATSREAAGSSGWEASGRAAGRRVGEANLADLESACAGLDLGAYDRQIIGWLAGWEPATVAVLCGLISRARAAPGSQEGPARQGHGRRGPGRR
jgi:hypothetical protein